MSGYAATGRISRATPRLAGTRRSREVESLVGSTVEGEADVPRADPRPIREQLAERWADTREEWGQATFFLFDPNSWR